MAWIKDCPENSTGQVPAVETVSDGSSADSGCAMTEADATFVWAWIVAIFCVGGMLGGCSVGLLSDKLGRKGALLMNNVLVLIASICMVVAKYANSYHILILGRFVIGVNSGINAGISPMYLSEISPVALRGAVGYSLLDLHIVLCCTASRKI